MSAYLYDEAIINNLNTIFSKNIFIAPAGMVLRDISEENNDNIQLPLISLTRNNVTIIKSQSQSMKTGGMVAYLSTPGENHYTQQLSALKIRIDYNLDVWSQHREENDDIVRELVWYYYVNPTLLVNIPYGLNISHKFNIFIDTNIEDNSDIVDHQNRGEYFRSTLSIYTDDAYLFKSTNSPIYIINPDNIDIDVQE